MSTPACKENPPARAAPFARYALLTRPEMGRFNVAGTFCDAVRVAGFVRYAENRGWIQSLGATQACNPSAGVLNPKAFWAAGLNE
jgi:hypothetical protein